jgi:hypothetical protein
MYSIVITCSYLHILRCLIRKTAYFTSMEPVQLARYRAGLLISVILNAILSATARCHIKGKLYLLGTGNEPKDYHTIQRVCSYLCTDF